jgi:hypothetical protein
MRKGMHCYECTVYWRRNCPELNARLDKIAVMVANPITREALQACGKVIKDRAEELVDKKTGVLAKDIVVVTCMRADSTAGGPGQELCADRAGKRVNRVRLRLDVLLCSRMFFEATPRRGMSRQLAFSLLGFVGTM